MKRGGRSEHQEYSRMTEINETELDKEADFLVYCPKGTRSSPCLWHQCSPTQQNGLAMVHDDSLSSLKQPYPVKYAQVKPGAREKKKFHAHACLQCAGWEFRKGHCFI